MFRAIVIEPIEQGGGIDAGQQQALAVKIEIGRGVAGGVPHCIYRCVQVFQGAVGIKRHGQQRQRPAHGLAVRRQQLKAQAYGGGDALADFSSFSSG